MWPGQRQSRSCSAAAALGTVSYLLGDGGGQAEAGGRQAAADGRQHDLRAEGGGNARQAAAGGVAVTAALLLNRRRWQQCRLERD